MQKINGKRPAYIKAMQHRSCICCGTDIGVVGHHIGHDRLDDRHAVPLCQDCHLNLHASASEPLWWAARMPDVVIKALKKWAREVFEDENDG